MYIIFWSVRYVGWGFQVWIPCRFRIAVIISFDCIINFFIVQRVIFRIFENIPVKKTINLNNSIVLDWLVFAIVIIGLFSSIFFSVGVLGASKDVAEDAPKLIFYFNSFFQPSLFVLVYLFYRYDSTRFLYYINFILYIILILVSGQTGQLLLLFCLYLLRKKSVKLLPALYIYFTWYRIISICKDYQGCNCSKCQCWLEFNWNSYHRNVQHWYGYLF